ncbi:MAG TPA: hypothetical protein PLQ76_07405 [bacterium]|nr:hypothetical protein [bacterium]
MKPDEKHLAEKGFVRRSEFLWSRTPLEDLNERIAAADIFISDLDECMFPSITQADAAMDVMRQMVSDPFADPGRPALILNMAANAVVLIASKKYQEITGDIQNSRLIRLFERFINGVPLDVFRKAADPLKDTYFTGVPEAVGCFSGRGIPVGVISLGLDIIIRELLEHIRAEHGVKFDFFDCTHVHGDSRGRFSGYDPEKTYTSNEDKRKLIRARCEQYGAKRCLVVGHDRDDIKMLDEARKTGGVTVGFRPLAETYEHLDAAVFAEDWRPLASLFRNAVSRGVTA